MATPRTPIVVLLLTLVGSLVSLTAPVAAAPCYTNVLVDTASLSTAWATACQTAADKSIKILICQPQSPQVGPPIKTGCSAFVNAFVESESLYAHETAQCIQRIPVGADRCVDAYFMDRACYGVERMYLGMNFFLFSVQSWASGPPLPLVFLPALPESPGKVCAGANVILPLA